MNFKVLVSDKTFLALAWPHILGGISQGITTLILLIALGVLSNSFVSFIEILISEIGRIIKWSIFLILLFNIGFLFINLIVMRYYQSAPPVGSITSRSSLKEISEVINEEDRADQYFFKYIFPLLILVIALLSILRMYFINGVSGEALRPAVTFVLPFAIALTTAHFSRVIVEAGILYLRYAIQTVRF